MSIGLGFTAIYVAISYLSRRKLRAASKVWAGSQQERVKVMQEGVGGLRDVLIDKLQPVFVAEYTRIDWALRQAQAVSSFIGMAPRFVIEAFGMVLIAGMALVLASRRGRIDGGAADAGRLCAGCAAAAAADEQHLLRRDGIRVAALFAVPGAGTAGSAGRSEPA